MSLDVVPVTAGSAHAALAAAVTAAKGGEVLRPVTVLVPTNAAGVIARRTLGRLGGVAAVDFLTLGQYLRPSAAHLPMARYYRPDEFARLKATALSMGFTHVESGPLVRSSYHAHEQADAYKAAAGA